MLLKLLSRGKLFITKLKYNFCLIKGVNFPCKTNNFTYFTITVREIGMWLHGYTLQCAKKRPSLFRSIALSQNGSAFCRIWTRTSWSPWRPKTLRLHTPSSGSTTLPANTLVSGLTNSPISRLSFQKASSFVKSIVSMIFLRVGQTFWYKLEFVTDHS